MWLWKNFSCVFFYPKIRVGIVKTYKSYNVRLVSSYKSYHTLKKALVGIYNFLSTELPCLELDEKY